MENGIRKLTDVFQGIDHIALAVPDLDSTVATMTTVLGFEAEPESQTHGVKTGMRSMVLRLGGVTVVVTQGLSSESPISKFVDKHGAGIQHVAFAVSDLQLAFDFLSDRGLEFSSPILDSDGLSQIFTHRNDKTGMMIEFIERRDGFSGFRDENVTRLFNSLEQVSK